MPLKTVRFKSLLGKIFLSTAFVFLLSLFSVYSGASFLIKESIENNFKRKARAETELLASYINSLIKNYNYTAAYTVINQTIREDPDIVGVRIREFSSNLIDITNIKGLKKCKNNLLQPCYYVVKATLNGTLPVEVKVLFSTRNLVNLIGYLRKLLTYFVLLLFLLSEFTIFIIIKDANRLINKIVTAIENWKKGGIEELEEEKWSPELENLVSKVIEMYKELQRERKLDYQLLLFTEEVLNILPVSKNEEDFIERIVAPLKALFGFKNVRLCRKDECGKEKFLTVTPELKLIFIDGNVPKTVLRTLKNIISGALTVIKEKREKEELLFGAVKALANAIDATSSWTRGHSEKVAEISVEIGKALDLPEELLEKLRLGALLHDIGKLGIPPEIINKPEKLTSEEYEEIKEHPIWGYRILKPVKAFADIIPMVLYHHERCDGSGYPEGLKCSQIPLLAKIVAVADVIEAMTAERPYKKPQPLEVVLEYLKAEVGKKFSPEVVEAAVEKAEEIRRIIERNGRGGGI